MSFSCQVMPDSLWPHGLHAAHQASLTFTISRSLLKLVSIESMMLSSHLILCHPLLLLPSVFPSIKVFTSELALYIRWPKYWSFSCSISPSNEYSGLISFRLYWFHLLAVQWLSRVALFIFLYLNSVCWFVSFSLFLSGCSSSIRSHMTVSSGRNISEEHKIYSLVSPLKTEKNVSRSTAGFPFCFIGPSVCHMTISKLIIWTLVSM